MIIKLNYNTKKRDNVITNCLTRITNYENFNHLFRVDYVPVIAHLL